MKKIFSNICMLALMTVAGVTFVSCEKDYKPVSGQFTMNVEASMPSDGGTKQLTLDGTGLHATWAAGEQVKVYKGSNQLGTLTPQNISNDGRSCRLSGTLTGTIAVDDELTLKFNENPNYSSQDGTLYSHVRTAELAGATASGIVAYVGTAGSVEEGNSTYKGIAISLGEIADPSNKFYCSNHADCNGEGYSFSDALNLKNGIAATTLAVSNNASHSNSHHAAVNSRNYSTARPAGASEWSLPSLGQWNMIAKGLTESNTDLSTTANSTFSYQNIHSKVAAAGGWGFTWSMYWSTTQCAGFENAEKYNWVANFGNGSGNVSYQIKDNSINHYNIFIRPFFAF